jgi:predicted RNA binding protein YcfA (HicA-like mRNA interferase family)
MPKKIRELIRDLMNAGFVDRGGKGSHRNFTHSCGAKITLSGNPSQDAKRYQERDVGKAIGGVRK